ncbi:MAG: hypothetical protein GY954_14375, partial [Alteromonas sp.]|nr:hypothetical protein [Alteromonas sp.]
MSLPPLTRRGTGRKPSPAWGGGLLKGAPEGSAMTEMPYLAENNKFIKIRYAVLPKKDIYSARLRAVLKRKYWQIDEAFTLLSEISAQAEEDILLNGLNPYEYNEYQLNRYFKDCLEEYSELWLDTDHSQKPREAFPTVHGLDQNPKLLAEYPVRYIIQWALRLGKEIHWLDWAVDEGFLSEDIKELMQSSENLPLGTVQKNGYLLTIGALLAYIKGEVTQTDKHPSFVSEAELIAALLNDYHEY